MAPPFYHQGEYPVKLYSLVSSLYLVVVSSFTLFASAENDTFILSGLTEKDYNPGTRQYLVYMKNSKTGELKKSGCLDTQNRDHS